MSHCIFQWGSVLLQHMRIVTTFGADMNSMYLVSVFPLSSLALNTWDIVNGDHLKKNAPPLSRRINKTACTGSYLWLWCSLVTGNLWSYIANKPPYLYAPILKLPYFLCRIHLSTRVHTIFPTTSTTSCKETKSATQEKHTNFESGAFRVQ